MNKIIEELKNNSNSVITVKEEEENDNNSDDSSNTPGEATKVYNEIQKKEKENDSEINKYKKMYEEEKKKNEQLEKEKDEIIKRKYQILEKIKGNNNVPQNIECNSSKEYSISYEDENKIKKLEEENKKYKGEIEKYKKINEDKIKLLEKESNKTKEKRKVIKEKDKEIEKLKKEIDNQQKEKINEKKIEEEQKIKIKEIEDKYKKEIDIFQSKIQSYESEIEKCKSENSTLSQLKKDYEEKENKFNDEMKTMKKEVENNLKEKYEGKFKEEIQKIKQSLDEKLEKKTELLIKSLNERYTIKENEMEEKFVSMSQMLMKTNLEKVDDIKLSVINVKHKGIKCEQCFTEPIIGLRYKCSQCENYNLCSNCEEKNGVTNAHPHDFIKIRKENTNDSTVIINKKKEKQKKIENKDNNVDNNKENQIIIENNDNENDRINNDNEKNINKNEKKKQKNIDDNKKEKNLNDEEGEQKIIKVENDNKNIIKQEENIIKQEENIIIIETNDNNKNETDKGTDYSYECINILSLSTYMYKGTKEAKIEMILKNNGNKGWPQDKTKLLFEKKSTIDGDTVELKPQKPGEEEKYNIIFKNLENLETGEYNLFYLFNIDGKNIGEKLVLKINIKEKKEENNEYEDKIKEFRENFGIETDFEDEKILELLKENDFNYEKTFDALFQ